MRSSDVAGGAGGAGGAAAAGGGARLRQAVRIGLVLARRGERGSAALEFALVLPILLVVTLGLVQAGLFVRDQLVLVEAARAGAREASVTADDDAVRAAVGQSAVVLSTADLSVEVDRTGQQGQPVSVRVAYTDPVVVPVVGWLFPSSVDLSASATLR